MLVQTRNIFKSNALFFLNIFVLVFLTYGLIITYGTTYLGQLSIYLGSFVGSYFILNRQFGKEKPLLAKPLIQEKWLNILLNSLIIFVAVFQIIHYMLIGNIPVIKAMMTTDYYYITAIRQHIKTVDNVLIKYTASFLMKSVIPVLLFILFFKDKRKFWIMLFIATFYAMALMQKAFIVTIVLPVILKSLLCKKWWVAIFFTGYFMTGVVALVVITNPGLRPFSSVSAEDMNKPKVSAAGEVSGALYDRVFIVTGKMVGNWFYYVPDSLPYLNGNGYRFATPLTGGKYMDYSSEIYKKTYVKEAKMGFDGTATSAYFMYDYANFGNFGLGLAGIYLAVFFLFIKRIFVGDPVNMFALNGLFVIWLSSAAFTTTFFSGGWLLTILLYLIFKPYFKIDQTNIQGARENN